jgi:hypothetical protein
MPAAFQPLGGVASTAAPASGTAQRNVSPTRRQFPPTQVVLLSFGSHSWQRSALLLLRAKQNGVGALQPRLLLGSQGAQRPDLFPRVTQIVPGSFTAHWASALAVPSMLQATQRLVVGEHNGAAAVLHCASTLHCTQALRMQTGVAGVSAQSASATQSMQVMDAGSNTLPPAQSEAWRARQVPAVASHTGVLGVEPQSALFRQVTQ